MSDERKDPHFTTCHRRIGRKVQPRQFESLEVVIECEDTIKWETGEERQHKLEQLTNLAVIDFQQTFKRVCEELGVADRPAAVTHKVEDGSVRTGAAAILDAKKSLVPTEDELDEFGDRLKK